MTDKLRSFSDLPTLVRQWMLIFDAYLIGSACNWFLDKTLPPPRDFDVIIEPHRFHDACKILTGIDCKINSFGAIKVLTPEIDVIPMSLGDFISKCTGKIAIHAVPFKVVRWE